MIILFLLTALIATIAVTIASGLAVLVVYLWARYKTALKAIDHVNRAYQVQRQVIANMIEEQYAPVHHEEPLLFVQKYPSVMH
jgi:uncharacterized protein YoxC